MSSSQTPSSTGATLPTGTASPPPPQRPPGPPPYAPRTAQLGGTPAPVPDIPASAALLLLFVAGAAANMTIFQRNRRRSYKFLFSLLLFAFCAARVAALALRIAWAAVVADPAGGRKDEGGGGGGGAGGGGESVRVAIAAQIFAAAGVLLLFVVNLVFAQRIIRAYHPFFGWSRAVTGLFGALFASAGLVLAMVVAVTVHAYFAKTEGQRRVDRRVQLFCATYLAAYAFLPVPLVTLAAVVPRKAGIDRFGEGHFRTKFALLTFAASLLAAGAVFRAVVAYYVRPVTEPAWFHSRACYYCFNYVIELVVVFTYALARFDKRFHIPDGSSAPGHYSCAEYGLAAPTPVLERRGRRRDSHLYGEKRPRLMALARDGHQQSDSNQGGQPAVTGASGPFGDEPSSEASEGRGETPSEDPSEAGSLTIYVEMAWMSRALRELYGDDNEPGPEPGSDRRSDRSLPSLG